MLLEDIKWEGPNTIDEVHAWGIDPLLTQLEAFDHYCERSYEDTILTFFYYDFRERVERLTNTLYRLMDELEGGAGAAAKAPTDNAQETPDGAGDVTEPKAQKKQQLMLLACCIPDEALDEVVDYTQRILERRRATA